MSASYVILPEHNLLVTTLSGRVTDSDLLNQQTQLRNDPGFRPDLVQLVDTSGTTEAALTSQGVREAARNTTVAPSTRRAIYTLTPSHFGLARMFELSAPGGEGNIKVFMDWSEACAWVGVPASVIAPYTSRGSESPP
jgi:hypothetical protein